MKLLSPGSTNTKLAKGGGLHARYLNFILHLAPADVSGYNVCPNASAGCKAACLNTAGRGIFSNVQSARIRKTKLFFEDRATFIDQLFSDLKAVVSKARRLGLKPVVRLNGTSDIPWESLKIAGTGLSILVAFPEIQFYDYTKSIKRCLKTVRPDWPSNYHLTFSRSETNDQLVQSALDAGVSVAVVYKEIPAGVFNADLHDFRFLDPKGIILGLTAKGRAKRDQSGFVVGA